MKLNFYGLAPGFARAVLASTVALVLLAWGCSRVAQKPKANEFFVTWLLSHGETNIVEDANGVGLAGNPTRLRSSRYDSTKRPDGKVTAEIEFRVRLPDGREIIEYVAGIGDSLEKAENDARLNFVLTTFHVVYRSFLNPADPHQTEKTVTINGQPRVLVMGDTITRRVGTNKIPGLSELQPRFQELLSSLPLSPQTHWMKIVYAQQHSKIEICAVTLDNEGNDTLTEAVQKLPWPMQEDFYMVKQFVVVK